jgi:trimeric autotransporter adhesin
MVAGPAASGQDCAPSWTLFPGGGCGNDILDMIIFDEDGEGPDPSVLIVAGSFFTIGGVVAPKIARWDGHTWTHVGGGMNNDVDCLAVFDEDGRGPNPPRLFAGGSFTTAGFQPANKIARWDGHAWSAVGGGVNNDGVFALLAADLDGDGAGQPVLYVGGNFTMAGGAPANRIAQWDGHAWSPLGAGITGSESNVGTMTTFDSDGPGAAPNELVVGGTFAAADALQVNHVARWDGMSWSALGVGVTGNPGGAIVHALRVFDEDGAGPASSRLFVGGSFQSAGGDASIQSLARWNGIAWSSIGDVIGGGEYVNGMYVHDVDGPGVQSPRLYVGGYFNSVGGVAAKSIAAWDGQSWSSLGAGVTDKGGTIDVLLEFDEDGHGPLTPTLYVGGRFDGIADLWANENYNIARWNGSQWLGLGIGLDGFVGAMTVHDIDGEGPQEPALVVGGGFNAAAGYPMPGITAYDDGEWLPLGAGLEGIVYALLSCEVECQPSTLIAAGTFIDSGGDTSVKKIATWDGATWHSLGGGVSGGTFASEVFALCLWDPDDSGPQPASVYAGGEFTHAGGVLVNRIARWNGTSWSSLAGGMDDAVYCLHVYDPDGAGPQPSALFAGGEFGNAGGVSAVRIAKWNGAAWSPLGTGLSASFARAYALASFDTDGVGPLHTELYVGGVFSSAGGVPAANIARWNGSAWLPLLPGAGNWVTSLFVADINGTGSPGPDLYAGGLFDTIGGMLSPRIARWDGTTWNTLGPTVFGEGAVLSIYAFDPDHRGPTPTHLFMGGAIVSIDGQSTQHFAEWGCPAKLDPADLNGDGVVNGLDLALLLGAWTGAASYAPCPPHAPADPNSDCKVNGFDLALLLGAWG